jgi:hypothetical protein
MRKLVALILLISTAERAAAESITLNCKLDRGWEWTITLDLEARSLAFANFPPVPIVEMNEEWIVAMSSSSMSASETIGAMAGRAYVATEQWVFNRVSGRFWNNSFGFFSQTTDIADGDFDMQEYRGTCTRGF